MYQVANIGIYDNNHKLYEVTNDTRHGKTKYLEKTTYIVANNDADKFEHFYEKENQLFDDMKICDTPEHQKQLLNQIITGIPSPHTKRQTPRRRIHHDQRGQHQPDDHVPQRPIPLKYHLIL